MDPVAWIARKVRLHLNYDGRGTEDVLRGPEVGAFCSGEGANALFLYVGPELPGGFLGPGETTENDDQATADLQDAETAHGADTTASEIEKNQEREELRRSTSGEDALRAVLDRAPPLAADGVSRAMYFIRNHEGPLPGAFFPSRGSPADGDSGGAARQMLMPLPRSAQPPSTRATSSSASSLAIPSAIWPTSWTACSVSCSQVRPRLSPLLAAASPPPPGTTPHRPRSATPCNGSGRA